MKYLLGLILLVSVSATAQYSPTAAKTRFVNGIGLGTKDTLAMNAADTVAMIVGRDSLVYFRYKGYWKPLAYNSSLGSYVKYTDTASMLSGYLPLYLRTAPTSININNKYFNIYGQNAAGAYTSGRIDITGELSSVGYQKNGSSYGLQIDTTGTAYFISHTQKPINYLSDYSANFTTNSLITKGYISTGYVPYTGATADVDLDTHILNAQALHAKGTAGNGHLGLKHQSAAVTGTANESNIYANTSGDMSWLNGNKYLSVFATSANTAARTYTFPNTSGTVILSGDTATMLSPYIRTANYGLTKTSQGLGVDTALIATRLRVQKGIDSLGSVVSSGYVPYTGATGAVNLGAYGLTSSDLLVSKNQNATTFVTLSNTTSGTASWAEYRATSNTTSGTAAFGKYSATTNSYKILLSNDAYLYNGTAGDIAILNDYSSGKIKFAAGASSTAQMTLATGGALLIAQTSDNGIDKLQVTGSSYFSTNVGIGTASTGGFKLDVNGTARVQNTLTVGATAIISSEQAIISNTGQQLRLYNPSTTSGAATQLTFTTNTNSTVSCAISAISLDNSGNQTLSFLTPNAGTVAEKLRIWNTGNVTLQNGGTFTDAGYRLDVNGTARVQNTLTVGATALISTEQVIISSSTSQQLRLYNTGSTAGTQAQLTFTTNSSNTSSAIAAILLSGGNQTLSFLTPNAGTVVEKLRIWNTGNILIQNGGTFTDVASSILTMSSTTKGFLPPRMTTTQKNAISSPATGLMVYDTTLNKLAVYTGSAWETITSL